MPPAPSTSKAPKALRASKSKSRTETPQAQLPPAAATAAAGQAKKMAEKRGHVCPPSDAKHPCDRWESLFVYAFIIKFTNLKGKVQGFETPMDLEEALMSREPNDIMTRILARFILNLKPQTRNLSTDQISTTLMAVLAEYLKTSERTMFWDDTLKANVDPFAGMESGFFAADWDFKLKILRQLVELQLTHSQEIKSVIDRTWGVVHNKHKKEKDSRSGSTSGEVTRDSLLLVPFGQDMKRERYWIADDSPRVYVSTNPWKITATFKAVSSTREEYLTVIKNLKANAPEVKKGKKTSKVEQYHMDLIARLEERIEAIEAELARVARVRKKIEQNRILMAQAELRQTRTRRQAQKPDYVYYVDDNEDEGDDYQYQEEQDDEFENEGLSGKRPRRTTMMPTRRSTRAAAMSNGKREGSSESSTLGNWRGERRSARLGFQDPFEDMERPHKRARTEESATTGGSRSGSVSVDAGPSPLLDGEHEHMDVNMNGEGDGVNKVRVKTTGAAALKPNEIALESVAGKKRSKFWVYAVEPID